MKYYASRISDNISETPEGYLLCIGVPVARTGEQEYAKGETPLEVGDDGIVMIQRDPEEVFRPQTIASFEGKPFTIRHPENFVGPDNWRELAKGIMQNVRRGTGDDKECLIADILITDAMAISLVKNGLRGLSCGYEAEYVQTGEGRGKQMNIIGNHLALVEEGRAGSKFAINDQKGASFMSKTLKEKFLSAFGMAFDEAMKEDAPKKDEPAKDEDMSALDEVMKMCKDLGDKLDALKPKDEEPKKEEPKEEAKKDEPKDEEVAPSVEDRLKILEAAMQKLLEKESGEAGDEEEESEDEPKDDDMVGDEEESEDEDMSMVGDTASRAEILAPGIEKTKDVKVKALKAAYGTKDGKQVISLLTGGKAPSFDSADQVEFLFNGASELLKAKRGADLSSTKSKALSYDSAIFTGESVVTAEKMNEINSKHYKVN